MNNINPISQPPSIIFTVSYDEQTATSDKQKVVYSTFTAAYPITPEEIIKNFFTKSISLIDKTLISAKEAYPQLFK